MRFSVVFTDSACELRKILRLHQEFAKYAWLGWENDFSLKIETIN
jgi:hypothetical protein